MIGRNIIKQKYESWLADRGKTTHDDFIIEMAQQHNVEPEILAKVLEKHDWFDPNQ